MESAIETNTHSPKIGASEMRARGGASRLFYSDAHYVTMKFSYLMSYSIGGNNDGFSIRYSIISGTGYTARIVSG